MKKKKILIVTISIVATLGLLFGVCAIYVNDYYRADMEAINAFKPSCKVVEKTLEDGIMIFGDEASEYGFIFYPGGKVEYTAYTALMRELAANGMFCVLVKMPFNQEAPGSPLSPRWTAGGCPPTASRVSATWVTDSDWASEEPRFALPWRC